MKININQIIINTLDENRALIKSSTRENYLIYPDAGKVLKNIKTQDIYEGVIQVSSKKEISNYIEIDKEIEKEDVDYFN